MNKVNVEASDLLSNYGALLFVINSEIKKINTMEIVKVVGINKDKKGVFDGTINVMPVVKRLTTEGTTIEESVIYGVKCFGWQFGVNAIKAIPAENDIGIMVVSKRDISSIESGRVASNREFCLGDGVYIGGLIGFNATPTEVITFDDNGISVKSTKDVKIEAVNVDVNASAVAKVNAPSIELGEGAVDGVARYGDTVEVGGIQGTITSASAIVKAS